MKCKYWQSWLPWFGKFHPWAPSRSPVLDELNDVDINKAWTSKDVLCPCFHSLSTDRLKFITKNCVFIRVTLRPCRTILYIILIRFLAAVSSSIITTFIKASYNTAEAMRRSRWINMWWRHDMEMFSAFPAFCEGNPLVVGSADLWCFHCCWHEQTQAVEQTVMPIISLHFNECILLRRRRIMKKKWLNDN